MDFPQDPGSDDAVDLSASWQKERLSAEDILLVQASVLDLARGLRDLATSDEVHAPRPGSDAFGWLSSSSNWTTAEGSTHVENALRGITAICLSAASHTEVLVDSVQRGIATVATWTLTRTVLEHLGRIKFMLDAQDAVEFVSRHVALTCAELKYADRTVLVVREVGILDAAAYKRDLKRMVRQIGGTPVPAPTYSGLATALLDDAAPDSGSKMRHSQLSAVAQGELAALQMFLTTEGLVLPRALLVEASHMLCGSGILIGDMLRDAHMTVDSPTSLRWIAVRNRALTSAFAMGNSLG